MVITDDRIIVAMQKVAVLREQLDAMCLGKQGPVLSVMDLHFVVEQVYGLKIEMREVSFAAVFLRGKVERYADKRARILVRSGLSETEKRLAATKELCHIVLDEKDDWSTDGVAMIEGIMKDSRVKLGEPDCVSGRPLESEGLALAAAIELTYPGEYRARDAEKLQAGETTVSAIALYHDVPGFVVEEALAREAHFAKLREAAKPAQLAAE